MITTLALTPKQALNKAFLKIPTGRNEIENFKKSLNQLAEQMNPSESEEYNKNLISNFLKHIHYADRNFINTKGRSDLVIHNGKAPDSSAGVILEVKSPTNKSEMASPNKLNCKAFQELLLYYLRERIFGKNLEIRHLILTNIKEWFIFDSNIFEVEFANDKKLVSQFQAFEAGGLSGKNTEFFYKEIAEPAIEAFVQRLTNKGKPFYTYFELQDYKVIRRADGLADYSKLIALYKILSPQHLLKTPFQNDSNSLDKDFYTEYLHIIGLTEVESGSKKIIRRKGNSLASDGSILENTIAQLEGLDKISRLPSPKVFGVNVDEQTFNVALELVITWVNRILFLKLLEAQIISYNGGDKEFSFLNTKKITNFDDLNELFFQVLARERGSRIGSAKENFINVPYLNSSLFEPTELEHTCLFISQLQDGKEIELFPGTILKDSKGKRRVGKLNAIEYLFEFLDAYNFGSEGSNAIQEENKRLINASVLGLIFEKINGYKDGSFFTPGYITMHMCRETIRAAVIEKFNYVYQWECKSLDEIYNKIEDKVSANLVINGLKICDPAVGSGHYLVSALNELLSIKSYLGILTDKDGRTLRDYQLEVINDELIITDGNGELFEYNHKNRESQRVQETLFHEKQTLIENCLFGVDLNPNSVKICRLRLWIELLKHAYYRNNDGQDLETLPNIDINIKCGNSLIRRFSLDANLQGALKKSKITIKSYREAIRDYQHARDKTWSTPIIESMI